MPALVCSCSCHYHYIIITGINQHAVLNTCCSPCTHQAPTAAASLRWDIAVGVTSDWAAYSTQPARWPVHTPPSCLPRGLDVNLCYHNIKWVPTIINMDFLLRYNHIRSLCVYVCTRLSHIPCSGCSHYHPAHQSRLLSSIRLCCADVQVIHSVCVSTRTVLLQCSDYWLHETEVCDCRVVKSRVLTWVYSGDRSRHLWQRLGNTQSPML